MAGCCNPIFSVAYNSVLVLAFQKCSQGLNWLVRLMLTGGVTAIEISGVQGDENYSIDFILLMLCGYCFSYFSDPIIPSAAAKFCWNSKKIIPLL